MSRDFRWGKWSLLVLAAIALGGWMGSAMVQLGQPISQPALPDTISSAPIVRKPASAPKRDAAVRLAKSFAVPGARPNEMIVRFRSATELQAFLAKVRALGGRVLGVIPRLGAARIGFDDAQGQAIRDLVPDTASAGLNFLVSTPAAPDPQTDTGGPYLGFGHAALDWLGVPTDNSQWGRGVKVAVLDSGIYAVPGLSLQNIRQTDLLGGTGAGSGEIPVHGTAVASIIGGSASDARGVAPGAELLSYRVLDNDGVGDSFTVAQGILDAVDSGARVISMSIGSAGDSEVLREAVNYALSRNVALVAAVGNDGIGTVYYPAQYPGVIAVTAVDANGQRGGFANYGSQVTLAAPGIGVATPWQDQQEVNFSGTSAAVPFVSGTLAMLFAENPKLTTAQATNLLVSYANDAGAPGGDDYYGTGILDVSRILSRNQSGINDAAVADFYYEPGALDRSRGTVPVQITVQNRGTTTLSNVTLNVSNNGSVQQFKLSAIPAGNVQSRTIEINAAALQSDSGVKLQSSVQLVGVQDVNAANNGRSMILRLKAPTR